MVIQPLGECLVPWGSGIAQGKQEKAFRFYIHTSVFTMFLEVLLPNSQAFTKGNF